MNCRTKKKISCIVICVILLGMIAISISPTATVRATTFVYGHPIAAFKMKLKEAELYTDQSDMILYVYENAPIGDTKEELLYWGVKKIGPFYYYAYVTG